MPTNLQHSGKMLYSATMSGSVASLPTATGFGGHRAQGIIIIFVIGKISYIYHLVKLTSYRSDSRDYFDIFQISHNLRVCSKGAFELIQV